jgi:hypothetical protein
MVVNVKVLGDLKFIVMSRLGREPTIIVTD